MSRTIIRFEVNATKDEQFSLRAAPTANAIAHGPAILKLDPEDQVFKDLRDSAPASGVAETAGDALRRELFKQKDIQAALTASLTNHQPTPIYLEFWTNAAKAERFPWEALHDRAQDFLALDAKWPVARMVNRYLIPPSARRSLIQTAQSSRPILKVLAILSAARIDASGEWDALHNAFTHAAHRAGFDLRIHVLYGESKLESHIKKTQSNALTMLEWQQQPHKDPPVRLDGVAKPLDVLNAIQSFDPHVIHFFCHGTTSGGPSLRIAHAGDYQGNVRRGSVKLSAGLLKSQCSKAQVWMVVLNCCDSAKSTADLHSLARSLVGDEIPVVFAMREPVEKRDANAFAKTFYTELVDRIDRELTKSPGGAIDWAEITWKPRYEMHQTSSSAAGKVNTSPADRKEWTIPVLYVAGGEFLFDGAVSNVAASSAAQALAAVGARLAAVPGWPPGVQKVIDDGLDRALHDARRSSESPSTGDLSHE